MSISILNGNDMDDTSKSKSRNVDDLSIEELEIILTDRKIVREIEEMPTRTHGTPSCYNAGCRGPMCSSLRGSKKDAVQGSLRNYIIRRTLEYQMNKSN